MPRPTQLNDLGSTAVLCGAKTCSHGKGWNDACLECEIVWVRGTIESFEPIVNDAKRKLKELEDALAKTTAVQA
jgi:hypothetical protein